jgi:hypothetical protein
MTSQSPDIPSLIRALTCFLGRVARSHDPEVANAVRQLRLDLKRAKIKLDN